MRVEREFSPTLGDYRPPSQTRTRVDESSSRDKTNADQTRENSRRLSTKIWAGSNSMRAGESRQERMRAWGQTRSRVWTLMNSRQLSLSFGPGLRMHNAIQGNDLKVIPLNYIAHPFCTSFFAWLACARARTCSELGRFSMRNKWSFSPNRARWPPFLIV